MRLDPLLGRWADDPAFAAIVEALDQPDPEPEATRIVVADAARPFLLAGLAALSGRLVVAVTATAADAEALAGDVEGFLGPDSAAVFPPWETLPHERLSPRSETVGRRLKVLHRVNTGDPALRVVAVPARALMQPLAPRLGDVAPVVVHKGDEIELDVLLERLVG